MQHGDALMDINPCDFHGTPEFEQWYLSAHAISLAHAEKLGAAFRSYNKADGTYQDMNLNQAFLAFKNQTN